MSNLDRKNMTKPEVDVMPDRVGFSVDTHIFRELGELLVGRDSTALAELVKNAYDADASKVTISGLNLGDPVKAVIRIVDDGNGMTKRIFQEGFLRIAGRQKEKGDRRSLKYKRRFTGEKGIGRLAAHKLARMMRLASVPDEELFPEAPALEASIDWDAIERATTLDESQTVGAVLVSEREKPANEMHGTWIELTRLRRKWTDQQRQRLYSELNDFLIPDALVNVDPRLYEGPRLVSGLPVRDEASRSVPFKLELTDDFDVGESFWAAVLDQNAWLLEIDATSTKKLGVRTRVTPSRAAKLRYPRAHPAEISMTPPLHVEEHPKFHARIVIREGQVRADGARRSFAQSVYGVRIYVEGFRVAPYGEPGNDWLHLDAEYTKRNRITGDDVLPPDAGLSSPYNRLVFGAVVLTQESSKPLRMLVNREGFVDDGAFDYVREVVQQGINFFVRHTAALKYSDKSIAHDLLGAPKHVPGFVVPAEAAYRLRATADNAKQTADQAVRLLRQGKTAEATAVVEQAVNALARGAANASDLLSEVSQTRILAAVGLQMGAFIHEVRSVQLHAVAIRDEVHAFVRKRGQNIDEFRIFLGELARKLSDLSQLLERQSTFLSDAISVDSRRRRSPQLIAQRFDSALNLLRPDVERRGIEVDIRVPQDLKTPPMFAAELTLVFSNLLSNAVKAAGDKGKILCRAHRNGDDVVVRMENTGVRVNLDHAERWFLPFESTSSNPEPSLGIGMGLGLPITRDMLAQYGGSIRFVLPTPGYASALEFSLPSRGGK
jgi:signal transduction histidine kinase